MKFIDSIFDFLSKYFPYLERFRTISKYLFISVIATIFDIGLLYILTDIAKIYYIVSATISFVIGTVVCYIGQKIFTFNDYNKNKKEIVKQFSMFVFISIGGLIINLVILKLFVEVFGLWYIYSKLIAIGFGFIWNYFMNKKFTFKK
ncbi:MAG: GtrA family protein [archaeon]